ncbi:hypothetical protein AMECASPLE_006790 [Ameca splendens]|uniref:Uncharacterized protein n=1 Tax=Ameca splendens TaxID=208324 RepID=A0ABV0Z8Z2_9TELE
MKIPVTPPTPLRGLLPPLPGLPPALWQGVGTRAGSRITGDPSRQTAAPGPSGCGRPAHSSCRRVTAAASTR